MKVDDFVRLCRELRSLGMLAVEAGEWKASFAPSEPFVERELDLEPPESPQAAEDAYKAFLQDNYGSSV